MTTTENVYFVDIQYRGEFIDGVWTGVIQLFGRRQSGASVCVQHKGFDAYFYCFAPDGVNATAVDLMREAMTKVLQTEASADSRRSKLASVPVRVELVRRTPVLAYHTECDMFKISCSHPSGIVPMRKAILDDGVDLRGFGALDRYVFEANLDYVLRFKVDTGVRTCAWTRVTGEEEDTGSMTSSDDIMVHDLSGFVPYSDAEEMEMGIQPSLVLMSFDIECRAAKGLFPDAQVPTDYVIQIGVVVATMDGRSNADILSTGKPYLFNIGSADQAVVGHEVDLRCFANEDALLDAFAKFVQSEADPDFITGYNSRNFDWTYIVDRMSRTGNDRRVQFSRRKFHVTRNDVQARESRAFGATADNNLSIPGRCEFDMLPIIRKLFKLRSYKLDDVGMHFLDERKDDVKHTEISDLFAGSPQDRGRLGHYCVQDSWLPLRLMLRLELLRQYMEMARVTRVHPNYLTTRGEQIKVFTQLCYQARLEGYVVDFGQHGDEGYEGATVLAPVSGFYTTPVATLDFTSLYPSIMMAHNLCYNSYVPKDRVHEFSADEVATSPTGDTFVLATKRKGLLPKILDELLGARRAAKRLMGEAKARGDMISHAIFDKRQLALKVSANSVYGFTGVSHGKLPLQAIARSVTAYGRDMIDLTKQVVEEVGKDADAEVVYGDTDSVMIKFRCTIDKGPDGKLVDVKAAVAESRDLAYKCAAAVNAKFPKPINLEYEKVFLPFLLLDKKKRYSGGYFEDPADERMYVMTKGIENQRRDNCFMLPRVLDEILASLMDDQSPDRALQTAQDAIDAVMAGPKDPDSITVTCAAATAQALAEVCDADSYQSELLDTLSASQLAGFRKGQGVHALRTEWEASASALAAAKGLDEAQQKLAADTVAKVLRCNATYDDFVMSKGYGRSPEKYLTVAPQIEVLKRMQARDPATDKIAAGYRKYLGDRIPYIVQAPSAEVPEEVVEVAEIKDLPSDPGERRKKLAGAVVMRHRTVKKARQDGTTYETTEAVMGKKKKAKRVADRTEDPEWAQAHGRMPDAVYYIENQILGPTLRLVKPLVGSKDEAARRLLGRYARKISPQIGFRVDRFKPKMRKMILGRERTRKKKREASASASAGEAPTARARTIDSFFSKQS